MASPGKVFEEDFEKSASSYPDIDVNRLKDPVGGQAGVRNICDFIVYQFPYNYYFELKSRQGNTLNFKEISSNQWAGLYKKGSKGGNIPGVIVQYTDHNEVYFVHIYELLALRDTHKKKSLHIDDARRVGIKLYGEVKRVRYSYSVGPLLKTLGELYG